MKMLLLFSMIVLALTGCAAPGKAVPCDDIQKSIEHVNQMYQKAPYEDKDFFRFLATEKLTYQNIFDKYCR